MYPDFNVLDLGFFNAIQSLQHQKCPKTIDELVSDVHEAYLLLNVSTLKRTFQALQRVMNESLKMKGDDSYKVPHAGKDKKASPGSRC